MPGFIDDLVPIGVGDPLIKLELRRADAVLRAFTPIELTVTLTGDALTAGINVPLELTVMGPSKRLFKRTPYRRVVPTVVTFSPQEGGLHLIRLAETAHMNWWGAIKLEIAGERST
jgi:hypothetical protein